MQEGVLFDRKRLMALALPLIGEQILTITVGMADSMMASSCGESAVSGIALVDQINVLLITLFAALCTGGSIIVSQYLGHQEPEKARRSAGQLILGSLVISSIMCVVVLFLRGPLLNLFFKGIDADVMENALTYFLYMGISFPFLALYNCGASLFRVMGNSKKSLVVSLIANLTNIGLNAFFLYVMKWGVAGVAAATMISRILAAVILMLSLRDKRHLVYLELRNIIKPQWEMLRRILNLGVPNGIENSIFQVGKILVVGALAGLGTSAIAANSVASSIAGLPSIPGNALAIAMITVVGQAAGSGNNSEAIRYCKIIMRWIYMLMVVTSLLLIVFAPFIVSMYELEADTRPTVIQLVRFYGVIAIFFWPTSFALPNALRAVSQVRYTMVVSVLSMFIFRIGFSYVFVSGFNLGVFGVWIAMVIDWICRGICFYIRFFRGKWRTQSVLE